MGPLPPGRKFGFVYSTRELLLKEVDSKSQAGRANLDNYVGYVIHAVNGQQVRNGKEYVGLIDSLPIGSDITFTIRVNNLIFKYSSKI